MATTAAEIDAYVGQRMRQRRESLGISQGRLGRHLGLTFSQVQKYEKGTNRIGAGRLYLLGDFLGVPVQYFYEGIDDTQSSRHGAGYPGKKDAEMSALDDAFLSITDPETRRSLLALVCSVAASTDAAGRPRQSAG
jgi:transcriptional regulator with XRE-family HTH domain